MISFFIFLDWFIGWMQEKFLGMCFQKTVEVLLFLLLLLFLSGQIYF